MEFFHSKQSIEASIAPNTGFFFAFYKTSLTALKPDLLSIEFNLLITSKPASKNSF